jgi:hypothetical protein
MKIEQSTTFNFTFIQEGMTYNFNLTAASQPEACEKLHRALTQIVAELEESLRKPKPN